ncbi:hypothetical protein HPB47_017219 [Ixodes persulcatus]|uniref:Uncharacterized protein n=1 Tax=Ixodes persulcatus TaxID=34615 RepID=A0AC60QRE9_IXOPE|nr:hypothetical protein HPB47_017219 [Ixodes persulcatus]
MGAAMAKLMAKYNTRHKFGKRRKKSLLNNLKKPSAEPERTEDLQLPRSYGAVEAAETAELAETKVGPGGPSASERSSDSSCVRRDTAMLQSSDLEGMRKKADQKLQDFTSTAATKRKSVLFADMKDNADGSLAQTDEASFTVVNSDSLNALMKSVKWKICGGDVKIGKGKCEYGLAVKLFLARTNCGDISSVWSSLRVNGDQRINLFAVNILAARARQSTGNRQAALNDVFSAMNISHCGLHTNTWQDYRPFHLALSGRHHTRPTPLADDKPGATAHSAEQTTCGVRGGVHFFLFYPLCYDPNGTVYMKKKLVPAFARAAKELTTECAQSVRGLYRELNLGNPGNIAVSYNGSWMTRGHSSHISIGTAIELFTGFVLDYIVLSNFCAACERRPKQNDLSHQAWKDGHICQKTTDKKAGEMEVEAGLILFKRSWQRHNLCYTTVLSDGDSHTFLALQEAQVYGFIAVNKKDCVNHVQKRMGTALRTLITKQKKLTADLITKWSAYYGWALKSHKGDVEAMQRAVMVRYHHVTSNDTVSNHSLCPAGPDSWCRQNATKARGEPAFKHHYNLPPHVCKALLPLYERLSERKLLEWCQRGKTQNTNESLHSMIWALAPKHRHASLFSVEAAVAEAVLKFNAGNEIASARILRELNVTPGPQSSKRMVKKDKRRATASACKCTSADNVQRALKKRHLVEEGEPKLCEVVFDQGFVGGLTLRCSPNRGYKLSTLSLVNLSHGVRTQRSQQLYQVPARRQEQHAQVNT